MKFELRTATNGLILCPTTSRYSPKRIYIRIEPGDKHDDGESPEQVWSSSLVGH